MLVTLAGTAMEQSTWLQMVPHDAGWLQSQRSPGHRAGRVMRRPPPRCWSWCPVRIIADRAPCARFRHGDSIRGFARQVRGTSSRVPLRHRSGLSPASVASGKLFSCGAREPKDAIHPACRCCDPIPCRQAPPAFGRQRPPAASDGQTIPSKQALSGPRRPRRRRWSRERRRVRRGTCGPPLVGLADHGAGNLS
jgi:hypothetical protein